MKSDDAASDRIGRSTGSCTSNSSVTGSHPHAGSSEKVTSRIRRQQAQNLASDGVLTQREPDPDVR